MRAPWVAVCRSGPPGLCLVHDITESAATPASCPVAHHDGLCREHVAPVQHNTDARYHTKDIFWALKARLELIGPFS